MAGRRRRLDVRQAARASTSALTIAAPSTIARIFPKATSRGRYFRPQLTIQSEPARKVVRTQISLRDT